MSPHDGPDVSLRRNELLVRARGELPRELASFDNELAAVFGLRRMGEAIIEQDADAHAASQAPNKIDVLLPVRQARGLIPIAALRLLSRQIVVRAVARPPNRIEREIIDRLASCSIGQNLGDVEGRDYIE